MIKFVAASWAFLLIVGIIHIVDAESVALCYATDPPVAGLAKFDWAVVDSDANFNPKNVSVDTETSWLSYVSVGEVSPQRSYYKQMPKSWFMGTNEAWESQIVNQTAPGWPSFFVNTIAAPLWKRGFEGFFLDTLDSYQLVSNTDKQRKALANVINSLKKKYPAAILILNRGFELMPTVNDAVDMVAFESLFSGWDQGKQQFVTVSPADRDWLLARAKDMKTNYETPVLSIDYYKPKNTTWAKSVAKQIQQKGIIPYVTDPLLQTLGFGPPNMN